MDPEGSPLVQKEAVCPVCKGEKAHEFSLNAIAQASENEYVMCPNTKLLVALGQIAPDVVMEDIGDQYRIDGSKLELDIKRARLLGDGAFGNVYRARFNGKPVAAKVWKFLLTLVESYRSQVGFSVLNRSALVIMEICIL